MGGPAGLGEARARARGAHQRAADVHERAAELHTQSAELHEEHAQEMAADPARAARAWRISVDEHEAATRELAKAARDRAEAERLET